MKTNPGELLFRLLVSEFFGITVVAIGLGVVITPLLKIAAPFVCPGGDFLLESEMYSYKPGQTGVIRNWYCVTNPSVEPKDVTFIAMLVAGIIYGLIIFILWTLFFSKKPNPQQLESILAMNNASAQQGMKLTQMKNANQMMQQAGEIAQRLKDLQELLDAGYITQQEFEEKRAEIIKQI